MKLLRQSLSLLLSYCVLLTSAPGVRWRFPRWRRISWWRRWSWWRRSPVNRFACKHKIYETENEIMRTTNLTLKATLRPRLAGMAAMAALTLLVLGYAPPRSAQEAQ